MTMVGGLQCSREEASLRSTAALLPSPQQPSLPPPSTPPESPMPLSAHSTTRTFSERPGPEPESINAIIRAHARSRLYVPPIAWSSSQQLRLLGCDFVRKSIAPVPVSGSPSHQQQHILTWQKQVDLIRAARYLRKPSVHTTNRAVVQGLLQTYDYAPIPYENLPLRFGRRIVDKVWFDSLFSSNLRTALPTFAHIHYDTLHRHRRRHVNSSRKRRFNPTIEQLERAKLRRLQPTREEEDPYIIAILIAMAQEQQCLSNPLSYSAPARVLPTPTSFKVNLIASPDPETPCVWVYKASIPSSFLDRFDEPSRSFANSDFKVRYCRIPFTAPETFADRLHRVLSSTVARGIGPITPPDVDGKGFFDDVGDEVPWQVYSPDEEATASREFASASYGF